MRKGKDCGKCLDLFVKWITIFSGIATVVFAIITINLTTKYGENKDMIDTLNSSNKILKDQLLSISEQTRILSNQFNLLKKQDSVSSIMFDKTVFKESIERKKYILEMISCNNNLLLKGTLINDTAIIQKWDNEKKTKVF